MYSLKERSVPPFQATVTMEGAKLCVQFPNYHHMSEISGGKLVEVSSACSQGWAAGQAIVHGAHHLRTSITG